jgi:hypothetical protein
MLRCQENFKYQARPSDVTFNTRVVRTPQEDGLAYYSVVPYSNAGTRVSAAITLTFVKVAIKNDSSRPNKPFSAVRRPFR